MLVNLIHVRSRRQRVAVAITAAAVLGLCGAQLAGAGVASATPTESGLWAGATDAGALTMNRSILMTDGLVHSEGAISFNRTKGALTGGLQYGSTLTKNTKIKFSPPAQQVVPGSVVATVPAIADYRPGGTAALAASTYTAVDSSRCVGGNWSPGRTDTFTGVVYVPCSLSIAGSKMRGLDATFAVEGGIQIWAQKVTVGQASGPALISGATGATAVLIAGTKVTTRGRIFAPNGDLNITSAAAVFHCGAVAQHIAVARAALKVATAGC